MRKRARLTVISWPTQLTFRSPNRFSTTVLPTQTRRARLQWIVRGKSVLVTGASKGIGRVMSQLFAKEGAAVVCAARSGALVEETALIARWLAQPGVRIVRAEPGWASPAASAGRWAAWAASARSARAAADQVLGSDLLSEPHPSREQLFGSTGIDRVGGAGQARLPGGHPFGVAG